ncbi:MAG: hypothetical protein ABSE63_09135 [Thermoguttaceae bacterium]|jgi:hypothetical protein
MLTNAKFTPVYGRFPPQAVLGPAFTPGSLSPLSSIAFFHRTLSRPFMGVLFAGGQEARKRA